MWTVLILILSMLGESLGYNLSQNTLYQSDLAKKESDYISNLVAKSTNEKIDSIKFEPGKNELKWDYIPQILIRVDTTQVVCGENGKCRFVDGFMHSGKPFRDSVFKTSFRKISFLSMGDCVFDCLTIPEPMHDCPAWGMPNSALYKGILKIYSTAEIDEINLIGHSYMCGSSFINPLDPVSISYVKPSKKETILFRYNILGKRNFFSSVNSVDWQKNHF